MFGAEYSSRIYIDPFILQPVWGWKWTNIVFTFTHKKANRSICFFFFLFDLTSNINLEKCHFKSTFSVLVFVFVFVLCYLNEMLEERCRKQFLLWRVIRFFIGLCYLRNMRPLRIWVYETWGWNEWCLYYFFSGHLVKCVDDSILSWVCWL